MIATASSARAAGAGSSRSRSPTSPASVAGTGSGPLAGRVMPRRTRARPISSAMNGLPADSASIRRSAGCENDVPSRVRSR